MLTWQTHQQRQTDILGARRARPALAARPTLWRIALGGTPARRRTDSKLALYRLA